jgi:hypothetical protein
MASMSERNAIIARARQLLAETDCMPASERPLDPIARWKRDADKFTAECAAEKRRMHEQEEAQRREAAEDHTASWVAYFERRLIEERALIIESVGMAVGQIRAELYKAIAKEIAELRTGNIVALRKKQDTAS